LNGYAAATTPENNIYASITGKISGDKCKVVWKPNDDVAEFRETELKQKKITPEIEAEIQKHPGAFYNFLFSDLTLTTAHGAPMSRVAPFIPAKPGRQQNYPLYEGEDEARFIFITPAEEEGVTYFYLFLFLDEEDNIDGMVSLDGNKFSYQKGKYEFEAAIYNGFVVVSTIKGVLTNSKGATIKPDGVYPMSLGFNFYQNKSVAEIEKSFEKGIINDILALPEMQFKRAAAIIEERPTDAEPFYTIRAGSNADTHFATSFWFHVYTYPDYEIRLYDVASDSELSLDEWRGETGEIPALTFHAYVKFGKKVADGQFQLLIDNFLWINGDDRETLKKYGFDPDNVDNDYEIYNEIEEWVPVITFPETKYKIFVYNEEGVGSYYDVDQEWFRQHLCEWEGKTIVAKVTVAGEYIFSVDEIYIP
jgi:hypothetical protein